MDQSGSRSSETDRILSWLCTTREPSQAESVPDALSARPYMEPSGALPAIPPPELPLARRLARFDPRG